MSIFTKSGDDGTTALFGGQRLSKAALRVEAYGSVDELTSHIGLVVGKIKNKKHCRLLISIQKDLYLIMGFLAGSKTDFKILKARVFYVEKIINQLEKKLPQLNRFIIPGGTKTSAWFHILRSVCRRTERSVIRFFNSYKPSVSVASHKPYVIKYLNRLSDLFFILARNYNKEKEILA